MSSTEYEQKQLELIAQSYRLRGFKVDLGRQIRGFALDAVATNDDTDEIFIIELVNARRGGEPSKARRVEALEAAAIEFPKAKVDLRYVDVDVGVLSVARRRSPQSAVPSLNKCLKTPLPRQSKKKDTTLSFFELWRFHIALLRAYSSALGMGDADDEDVLVLYNQMLNEPPRTLRRLLRLRMEPT